MCVNLCRLSDCSLAHNSMTLCFLESEMIPVSIADKVHPSVYTVNTSICSYLLLHPSLTEEWNPLGFMPSALHVLVSHFVRDIGQFVHNLVSVPRSCLCFGGSRRLIYSLNVSLCVTPATQGASVKTQSTHCHRGCEVCFRLVKPGGNGGPYNTRPILLERL